MQTSEPVVMTTGRMVAAPTLLKGDGHAILLFDDPTRFEYVREAWPIAPFKYGLPDVNLWTDFGDQLIGIEYPGFKDEEGTTRYRAFIRVACDMHPQQATRPLPSDAIDPASIVPGVPSRPYQQPV